MLHEILYFEGGDLERVAISAQYIVDNKQMIMVLGTNEPMENQTPTTNPDVSWHYISRLWELSPDDLYVSLLKNLEKDNWDYDAYPNPPVFRGVMSEEFAKLNADPNKTANNDEPIEGSRTDLGS